MIDWNFFLWFTCGAIGGCAAMGGFALCKFSEHEQTIRSLRKRLSEYEAEWIRKDRMKTWERDG